MALAKVICFIYILTITKTKGFKMATFEVNKKYSETFICDADAVFTVEILARTAKTLKAKVHGAVKTFRIFDFDGVEAFRPFGNYSMAMIIKADGK